MGGGGRGRKQRARRWELIEHEGGHKGCVGDIWVEVGEFWGAAETVAIGERRRHTGRMWRADDMMRGVNVGLEERGRDLRTWGLGVVMGIPGLEWGYLGWSGGRPEVRLEVQLLSGEEEAR